jgi:hypothetical protein
MKNALKHFVNYNDFNHFSRKNYNTIDSIVLRFILFLGF